MLTPFPCHADSKSELTVTAVHHSRNNNNIYLLTQYIIVIKNHNKYNQPTKPKHHWYLIMNAPLEQNTSPTTANPDIETIGGEVEYSNIDYTYEITLSEVQLGFARVVTKLGFTFDVMLYLAIPAFVLASVALYHAGFEDPVLLKHQMVIISLVLLVQSSVVANTFLVKQTVVNGNFTPALQITTSPDPENPSPRGHLLFINSLYKGSITATLFLAFVFAILMFHSIYQVGTTFDLITSFCFIGYILLNVISSFVAFGQQKKVAKLLLATSNED